MEIKMKGWILTYTIVSFFLIALYSLGLSGFFLDYPLWLALILFLIFSIPLLLLIFKHPNALKWNIILVWVMFGLMTLRIISIPFIGPDDNFRPLSEADFTFIDTFVGLLLIVPLAWAIFWTMYFKKNN